MARTAGRSSQETRTLIVRAAERLIGQRGTAVPMSDIAEAAGVSKGGLLYHFPTKESLLQGVASDLMARFRDLVDAAAAEEPEGTPGRLTRAYIRVNFAHAADAAGLRDSISLAVQLMLDPGSEAIAQADAAQWRAALHDDGLDPAVTRLIIAAADGSNSAPLWGAVLTDDDRGRLEADLIAQTRRGH